MFYHYEIVSNKNEEILYLYLTYQYEFAKDFLENDQELGRRANNFIQQNKIPFKGEKIFLIVDGIVVKSINLSKNNPSLSIDNQYSCNCFLVNIRLEDDSICEITLKEYLASILISNYFVGIHDEVLKALCVLYTTFAYKEMKESHVISSTNSFSCYKPLSYYQTTINHFDSILESIYSIIMEVNCIFIQYQNNYILPFIHFSNSGKTNSNKQYPYLSCVKSLWDLASPYYLDVHDFSYSDISERLHVSVSNHSKIRMLQKDTIKKLSFDNQVFTIEEIKSTLNLKSTDIYIIVYHDFLRFVTMGCGNGYGLSIFGANEMAKNGLTYNSILNYYFPKTILYRYMNKELSS